MAEYIKKALVAREIRKLLRVRESAVDIFQAGFEFGVNLAWVKINKIPAADVAPVVHGRWLNASYKYLVGTCSLCGCEPLMPSFRATPYKYCPNCGAKMDEEEHNG